MGSWEQAGGLGSLGSFPACQDPPRAFLHPTPGPL